MATHLAAAMLIAGAFAGAFAGTRPATASTSAPRQAGTAGCPAWTVVKSTDPYAGEDALDGVAVLSATNVWAVGDKSKLSEGNAVFRTLIEHWNGHSWKAIPSPNPGVGDDLIGTVTAVSANNVWAAGSYSDTADGATNRTLILHWNGRTWKQVFSPNPGSSFELINTIHAVSATNIWAVGAYSGSNFQDRSLALHWNGHSWSQVAMPNPGKFSDSLTGLAIGSATSIWTAEFFERKSGGAQFSEILRWNGRSWHVSLAPASYGIADLSASSNTNAWAVGSEFNNPSLALHWNGRSWKRVPTPNLEPKKLINSLTSVTVVSPTSAWAVGAAQNFFSIFEGTAIEMHWNGRKWSMMKSPFNPGANSALFGIEATPTLSPWAVGEFGDSIQVQRTWVLRCR